jgi:uncharacterized membrane protein
MGFVDETIIVSVDVADAYSLWLDYERYPRFMEDVDEVAVVGYRRLRWRAEVCGKALEWDSDVVDHMEDTRLRWRAVDGRETGDVHFQKLDHRQTLVHFQLEYEPAVWGVDPVRLEECLRARVRNALGAFKELAESVAA